MKKFFYLFAFIIGIQHSFAQDKNTVYLTYGLSSAVPIYNKDLIGAGSYDASGSSSFGFRFLPKSKLAVALETGVDYTAVKFTSRPAFYPGLDLTPTPQTMSLITIPIYANLTFLKYAFVNGGALIDFEVNKNNTVQKQTGLGFGLGIGGKYRFKNVTLMVNPFFQRHAYFSSEKNGSRQSLINSGVRVGVGYYF